MSSRNTSPVAARWPESDLATEFIAEALEAVSAAEVALLELETNPDRADPVDAVFRNFHSIKGNAAFLGLEPITEMAHQAENFLTRIREGEIRCSDVCADLALQSADMLRSLLLRAAPALRGERLELPAGYRRLLAELADPVPQLAVGEAEGDEEASRRLGDILVSQGKLKREELEAVASAQGVSPLGEALLKSTSATVSDIAHALRAQRKIEERARSSTRVRTDRLDQLDKMVDDLKAAQKRDDLDEVGRIAAQMEDLTRSLRLVSLRTVFRQAARAVRDLARKSGKSIEFRTLGEDIEVDRSLSERIRNPLIHMARNAVDHGVEAPGEREKAGKPPQATICLRALASGDSLVLKVEDDGRGLDQDRIVRQAVLGGAIDSSRDLTQAELLELISRPGFSTAPVVTDVSGRGVGMDVIRDTVESLEGRLTLRSRRGVGTAFTIVLPLGLKGREKRA